jgi:hypothetical protein
MNVWEMGFLWGRGETARTWVPGTSVAAMATAGSKMKTVRGMRLPLGAAGGLKHARGDSWGRLARGIRSPFPFPRLTTGTTRAVASHAVEASMSFSSPPRAIGGIKRGLRPDQLVPEE